MAKHRGRGVAPIGMNLGGYLGQALVLSRLKEM